MGRNAKRTKRRPSAPGPRPTRTTAAQPAGALSDDVAAALRTELQRRQPARPAPSTPRTASTPSPAAARTPASARAETPTGTATPASRVEVSAWSCGAVDEVEPQGLGMTHWVEVPEQGPPSTVRVRFTGRGAGEGARFVRDVTVGPVPAGVGRVAVTGRVTGLARGEWEVQAVTLDERGEPDRRAPRAAGSGRTTFGPAVRALAPGVRPYAWPSLVVAGTVLAWVAQVLLASRRDLPAGRLLAVTVLACVLGALGGKAYYMLTHRGQTGGALAAGMSIQGFVLAAVGTLVVGVLAVGVPLGQALDVTAPGMLGGMAVGRLGCWFGGCCAGRPTTSRWGLWSSDRVLGARRIPVQFLESAMTATLAVVTGLLVATGAVTVGGTAFVIGLALYTLGRQGLFPLRDIPRLSRWGRPLVAALMLAAVVAAVAIEIAR